MSLLSAPNLSQGLGGLASNTITLASGETWMIPGGEKTWLIKVGRYTSLQQYDPISNFWRTVGGGVASSTPYLIVSDGQNYRLANQTGCAVGALLTTAGSGYTSAPTVTASAGASVWTALVGGAVNTSVTVTAGGQNYTYPPTVVFSLPGRGGIPASGYCTLSAGAVSTVTVTNQGAGYSQPPTITFVSDQREISSTTLSDGYGAAAIASLTGSGTVTGVICNDHGVGGQTSLPTLSFSGGGGSSAAATAIGCFTISAYTVTGGGSGFSGNVLVTAYDIFNSTSAAYTNANTQSGLVKTRQASVIGALSGGAITATGQVLGDGGIFTNVSPGFVTSYNTPPATAASLGFTMGGTVDTTTVFPV